MFKKLMIIAVVGLAIAFGVYKYSMRAVADVSNDQAKINTTFADINSKINNNDTAALNSYTNQIISVSGNVRSITKGDSTITISIGDTSSMNTVECQIDSRHQQDFAARKENETIAIKGVCAGNSIDDLELGGSVQMKNCVLSK
jgi:tRNA_anti-like